MTERREIAGFSAYEASTDGQIFRKGNEHPRKPDLNNKGYLTVRLPSDDGSKHHVSVHRMVCIAFRGPQPDGRPHAAHLNSDKTDNREQNLAWKTPKENEADKVAVGRSNKHERNGRAKLTRNQVDEIRASTATNIALAAKYGISPTSIGEARNGVKWK